MRCDQQPSGAHFLWISKYLLLFLNFSFMKNSILDSNSISRAWSLSIGRLPHFSRDTKLATKPAIVDHVESSAWIPYTDDGMFLCQDR
jgi:hypothetical protein